jgi:hypothetical protein
MSPDKIKNLAHAAAYLLDAPHFESAPRDASRRGACFFL